jgi:hypothetical protein
VTTVLSRNRPLHRSSLETTLEKLLITIKANGNWVETARNATAINYAAINLEFNSGMAM